MIPVSCTECHEQFSIDMVPSDGVVHCLRCNKVIAVDDRKELPRAYRLGNFEIIRLIGKGGMGNVYLALQLSMNRTVALKVLADYLTRDENAIRQFMNEVKTTGQMQHPNIITAIDAGEADGYYYMAMMYVDGETIEARMDREKFIPEDEALKACIMVGGALKYAWEKHKLIHRDIKPGNIMLNSAKEAFLMDMGIAQSREDSFKKKEVVEGSPFYMSPEQTKAEPLDWRTDMYSLGASLYHMVTGVPPYDASDVMKIVEMHSTAPFPDPQTREGTQKVTKELVLLIRKMMEKDAANRFESWDEFDKAAKKTMKAVLAPVKESRTQGLKRVKVSTGSIPAPAVKKKKSSIATLISLVLSLAVLGLCGYLGFKFYRAGADKNVASAMSSADTYVTQPGFLEDVALKNYKKVLELANKPGVSPSVKQSVTEKYEKFSATLAELKTEKKKVKDVLSDAAYQCKESEALIKEATALFKSGKDYKPKLRELADKIDALEQTINALTLNTEEEKAAQATGLKRIQLVREASAKATALFEKSLQEKKQEEQFKKQEEQQKKLQAAEKKRQEDEQKSQQQAMRAALDEYQKELNRRKDEIRLKYIVCMKKKEFGQIQEDLLDKEASKSHKFKELADAATAFDSWGSSIASMTEAASNLWISFSDCGKKFENEKISIKTPVGLTKNGKIQKIEGGIIYLVPSTPKSKPEEIRLDEIKVSELLPLLKKLATADKNEKGLFALALGSGEFVEASELMPSASAMKEEFQQMTKIYLKARIAKVLKDKQAGNSMMYEKLKREYEAFPGFSEMLKQAESSGIQ